MIAMRPNEAQLQQGLTRQVIAHLFREWVVLLGTCAVAWDKPTYLWNNTQPNSKHAWNWEQPSINITIQFGTNQYISETRGPCVFRRMTCMSYEYVESSSSFFRNLVACSEVPTRWCMTYPPRSVSNPNVWFLWCVLLGHVLRTQQKHVHVPHNCTWFRNKME